jgi:hypothetical protein
MTRYTVGDDQSVKCPSCGMCICLLDDRIDGLLAIGYVSTCEHCHKPFEVWDIDWTPTIWIKQPLEQ